MEVLPKNEKLVKLVKIKLKTQLSKNKKKRLLHKQLKLKKKKLAVARRKTLIASVKKKKNCAFSQKKTNVLNWSVCASKHNNCKKTSKTWNNSVWWMHSAYSSKSCATTKKPSNKTMKMMKLVRNSLLITVQLSKKMVPVEPWLKKPEDLWLMLMMKLFLQKVLKVKARQLDLKLRWVALARKKQRELWLLELLLLVLVKAIARNWCNLVVL